MMCGKYNKRKDYMPKAENKRGFTIIEVVLVLAIAGLIFLMVFIALPAMQRSQRDTQRRDTLSMMVTQITQYQANNRNKLPGDAKDTVTPDSNGQIPDGEKGGWADFYRNYLLAQGDTFEDPNGNPYELAVDVCTTKEGKCDRQASEKTFEDLNQNNVSTIYVTLGSSCEGETVVPNPGSRKVTVSYKLEGGGTYCSGN